MGPILLVVLKGALTAHLSVSTGALEPKDSHGCGLKDSRARNRK
jgi:hypothetical protein